MRVELQRTSLGQRSIFGSYQNSQMVSETRVADEMVKAYNSYSKIMASGLITSWQTDGETTETVTDLIVLGSKITADGDCSHEI